MTYLLFTLWILSLILVAGQLDTLVSHRIFSRFKLPLPEVSWWIPPVTTALLPGFGQFLNGQPLKALFIFLWPFATAIGSPIFKPWQLILVKTPFYLFSWWLLAISDAAVVGTLAHRKRLRSYREDPETAGIEARSVDMADFLNRRKRKDPDSV